MKSTAAILLFSAILLLSAAGAPAFTPPDAGVEDALKALQSVQALGEVALSPDGKTLVYGRTIPGRRGGADVDISALFIANARDGSHGVPLTACPSTACDEHGVAWSPDGRQLVFVTTDSQDQPQLAVADASGAHVRIVTHAKGPVDVPRWSPDGKQLAFLYSYGAEKMPGPLNPLARDSGVLSSSVIEQRLAVLPVGGGEPSLLGPPDLNVYEYDWSPDGARFVVTAAHGAGDANWWLAELDLIDVRSGAVTQILKPAMQMASPRWSGDGSRIAFIGGIMSDEGITGGDVYVVPASGGEPVNVTPNFKASVNTITWNASAKRLVATGFAAGDGVLVEIDADAHSQRELWRAPQIIWANSLMGFAPGDAGISLSRDGRQSAVIRQSYTSPPEIETGAPGKWKKITAFNANVQPLTGNATNVFWKSDEFNIQGMLIAPKSVEPGKRYPLVVHVHGGPSYAHYPLFPTGAEAYDAVLANRGYFVFAPNPRGSYGQGAAFAHANVRDFGYGDLRDILRGLDAVAAHAPIDPKRVGIAGWSYGGYMTMWSITQTDRFAAAVSGAGLSNWQSYYGTNNIDTWMLPFFGASVYDDPKVYERSSPMTFIKNVHTPTLLLGGDRDAEVPITQSYEYWNALRRHGVTTEFVVYPDEGHAFQKHENQADVMTRVVGWFDRFLKPIP
jgi:dipeptidyl aminopeptidase/acylaminoacyl peptidase